MTRLYLVQHLSTPIYGYWEGGPKSTFHWGIDGACTDGKSRVGSWGANHFFEVATGNSDRATLGNARRALTQRFKRQGIVSTFSYEESDQP